MEPSFAIGIDLGTTNCAVAYAPLAGPGAGRIHDVDVLQVQRPGEAAALPMLPSCLYAPLDHETAESFTLPWGGAGAWVAGACARWLGTRVQDRLVVSAKSWLCHGGVDRRAPILPWSASAAAPKISPVEASRLLLQHMMSAWDHAHPDAPMASQAVTLTVPASFDEVARSLTLEAAHAAGLTSCRLLEEPQAAFYDFMAARPGGLADALRCVRLVLVVDVGGGTTDFTLIQVAEGDDGPELKRIAVGDHLMLGGDNMDVALARHVEPALAGGRKLGASAWAQLQQAAREAKETLLADGGPEQCGVAIAGEGSRLMASARSTTLLRADVEQLLLDGFLPRCGPEAEPVKQARVALQELGLPYVQDPAITHHVVAFLRLHAQAGAAALGAGACALPRPDAVLLNGGVFHARCVVDRLLEVLGSWWPDQPAVRVLPHGSLDRAVARGAAYQGLVRRGQGRGIGGGAARAFYVGLAGREAGGAAHAVCVMPRGQEEGQPVDLGGSVFHLRVGQPVQFPLFATTEDRADAAGAVVEVGSGFLPLPPLQTLCEAEGAKADTVEVHLAAAATEWGTLELWCVSAGGARWKLEFNLRVLPGAQVDEEGAGLPPRFADVRGLVERCYGRKAADATPKEAKQLFRDCEKMLGPRTAWPLPALRELWSELAGRAKTRRRSPEHERTWLQLAGYCLRPGFGYAMDEWRCEQMFPLFREGVAHPSAGQPVWNDFWILWRRIAGGVDPARQQELWAYLRPQLAHRLPWPGGMKPKPKGTTVQGLDEMVRLAASLEHLEAAD